MAVHAVCRSSLHRACKLSYAVGTLAERESRDSCMHTDMIN